MEQNNRMSEIRGNLKNDMKDLISESANLVTGFFKRGLCTVRVMADKWKAFTHGISDAVDSLLKPSFIAGEDAPSLDLTPDAEPVVTVTESADRHFPVGKRMTLSEANELVRQADEQRHDAGKSTHTVKVKIDYMWSDTSDRYWMELGIGSGHGDLLGQMEHYLDACRANPAQLEKEMHFENVDEKYREDCRAFFLPFLHESVKDLSNNLLPYFRSHCEVAKVKQAAEALIPGMGEGRQEQYRKSLDETIAALRQTVNNRGLTPQPEPIREKTEAPRRETPEQPTHNLAPESRPSVKATLEKLKARQAEQPTARPVRHVTARPVRK